jgi:hypothetical protein
VARRFATNYRKLNANFQHKFALFQRMPNVSAVVTNWSADYQIAIINCPNFSGSISNFNNVSGVIYIEDQTSFIGDISLYTVSNRLFIENSPLITINAAMNFTAKDITLKDCNLSATEIDRIVQRAYDNADNDGIMSLTGNTAPSTTALIQINTMVNDRGWTITHD